MNFYKDMAADAGINAGSSKHTDLWKVMRKLHALDTKYVRWAQGVTTGDMQYMRDGKGTQYIRILTGSLADGSNLCKWMSADDAEVELDLQYVLARIPAEHYDAIVEPIAEKPDNVRLKLDLELLDDRHQIFQKLHKMQSERLGFLDSDGVVHQFCPPMTSFGRTTRDDKRGSGGSGSAAGGGSGGGGRYIGAAAVRHVWAIAAKSERPRGPYLKHDMGNLACNMWTTEHVPYFGALKLGFDAAPAIHCDAWPAACDFIARNRAAANQQQAWSPALLADIERSALDIVPKASPGGDHETEWRWSFACVETRLFRSLSQNQMIIYMLAKMIFYKYIKHTTGCDSKLIHSYWIKTTMLWMCERHPRDSDVWQQENTSRAVEMIYAQLCSYILDWHLPHFFVTYERDVCVQRGGDACSDTTQRRYSILKQHDQAALQEKLVCSISQVVAEPDKYIPTPSDIKELFEKLPMDFKEKRRSDAEAADDLRQRIRRGEIEATTDNLSALEFFDERAAAKNENVTAPPTWIKTVPFGRLCDECSPTRNR